MPGPRLQDFLYHLPPERIAQQPAGERHASRMMVLRRDGGRIEHRVFRELPSLLLPGDLLVLNETRVFPARLLGRRPGFAGQVELLLVRPRGEEIWECLCRPAKRLRPGTWLDFGEGRLRAEVLDWETAEGVESGREGAAMVEDDRVRRAPPDRPAGREYLPEALNAGRQGRGEDRADRDLQAAGADPQGREPMRSDLPPAEGPEVGPAGRRLVRMHHPGELGPHLEALGTTPLPPYIRRRPDDPRAAEDRERYQTVYARERGSIAAPTAGLHFTPQVLQEIARRGVETCRLTLHVGPGTFLPVRSPEVARHRMEPERFLIPAAAAETLERGKRDGRRVVAVGTTTTRALEHAFDAASGRFRRLEGEADLFIYPGYRFACVDALLTNFHLPGSTLLMLVSALAGRERVLDAYRLAVAEGYRFYSYGDCMLIV